MKKRIIGVGVIAFGCSLAIAFITGDRVSATGAPQTVPAERPQANDAECLACHGAGASKPAVAILQTRHGSRSDSRTPACRDCHGASETHIKAPSSPADVVFEGKSKSASNPEQRSAAC